MATLVGIAKASISAPAGEPMGGYWGRTAPCEPCRDELTCRALYIESPGGIATCIVSLDLIAIHHTFAGRCSATVAASQPKLHSTRVLICCTHTHTGPQTGTQMLGFGHASEGYMALLEQTIVKTVCSAAQTSKPAVVRHVRTPPLTVSINRRQRVPMDSELVAAPAAKKPRNDKNMVLWFEKAGATNLGQRPEGPTVPYADALQFLSSPTHGQPPVTIATLCSFACHPVCCGKGLQQSADYVHALRQRVEEATDGAPSLFLTGAAGDTNPRERGGGYASADRMGAVVGDAIAAALLAAPAMNGLSEMSVQAESRRISVPLESLPSPAEAEAFLHEQRGWLKQTQDTGTAFPNTASAPNAVGIFAAQALPTATIEYAKNVLASTQRSGSAESGALNVAAVAFTPGIALVGLEVEPFSEYALHLSAISPFPVTITVGYANGCHGYLPTHAEAKLWGGYEVVHAHIPYGQQQRLDPTAEHAVVQASLELLTRCHAGTTRASPKVPRAPYLLAEHFDSGFRQSHDTYNSIGVAPKRAGKVFYVLSSAEPHIGGKLFSAPMGKAKGTPTEVADLTAACADPPNTVVQGKAHVPLLESPTGDHVYFASHVGFYTEVDGMETLPVPPGRPVHLDAYPGGCVLRLSVESGEVLPLARLGGGEGIITMAADFARSRIFCLSWPSAWLCIVGKDPRAPSGWSVLHQLDYPGRGHGESVHPRTGGYRAVCRSMAVDPRSGKAYLSNTMGDVLECDAEAGSVRALLSGADGLVRDYFGKYDPTAPGSMGYHWRQVQWVDDYRGGCIIGMHGNSGYMFELATGGGGENPRVVLIERLTSIPSRRLGLGDQFSYGYLGFEVKGGFAYYLTGGPITGADGKRVVGKAATNKGEAKGLEHLHLVTYCLQSDTYADHGPIFYRARIGFPTYVNSIAVGGDGWIYALGNFPDGSTDLFRIHDPHHSPQ